MGASTAGYCVGNLLLDKFTQSWEDPSAVYPANLASPLQILIDASNGASDYGNKFGEPMIAGYTRTFGMRLPNGSRREWIKPIMFRSVHSSVLARIVTPRNRFFLELSSAHASQRLQACTSVTDQMESSLNVILTTERVFRAQSAAAVISA